MRRRTGGKPSTWSEWGRSCVCGTCLNLLMQVREQNLWHNGCSGWPLKLFEIIHNYELTLLQQVKHMYFVCNKNSQIVRNSFNKVCNIVMTALIMGNSFVPLTFYSLEEVSFFTIFWKWCSSVNSGYDLPQIFSESLDYIFILSKIS